MICFTALRVAACRKLSQTLLLLSGGLPVADFVPAFSRRAFGHYLQEESARQSKFKPSAAKRHPRLASGEAQHSVVRRQFAMDDPNDA